MNYETQRIKSIDGAGNIRQTRTEILEHVPLTEEERERNKYSALLTRGSKRRGELGRGDGGACEPISDLFSIRKGSRWRIGEFWGSGERGEGRREAAY